MKITGKLEPSSVGEKLVKPQGGAKTGATASADKAGAEGAVATKLSGQFGELKAPEAPFDANKVAQIQQAIREGKFEVNAEAVASKVIESARELLGQK